MKERPLLAIAALGAALATYGLAGGPPGTIDRPYRAITHAELARQPGASVYDRIEALRPGWMRPDRADAEPVPYIEIICTTITCLRWVEAGNVEEVVLVDPEATRFPWPRQHGERAIVVRLRSESSGP